MRSEDIVDSSSSTKRPLRENYAIQNYLGFGASRFKFGGGLLRFEHNSDTHCIHIPCKGMDATSFAPGRVIASPAEFQQIRRPRSARESSHSVAHILEYQSPRHMFMCFECIMYGLLWTKPPTND